MNTERNIYGLKTPLDYEMAENRLMWKIAQDHLRGQSHFPANLLEKKDIIAFGISIDMMYQLNQITDVFHNQELERKFKEIMDKYEGHEVYEGHEMIEIQDFVLDNNFPGVIHLEVTNYLLFKSRLNEHLETKKGNNGNR